MVRLKNGRLQMRRAQPGKLTREAERAFLGALAATCNKTLAADAVGADFAAFNRRRKRNAGFARAVRDALEEGYDELEAAAVREACAALGGGIERGDAPAITQMTAAAAISLLDRHRKTMRLRAEGQARDPGRADVEEVRARIERTMRTLGLIRDEDEDEGEDGDGEALHSAAGKD
jgi:hypothetical protein